MRSVCVWGSRRLSIFPQILKKSKKKKKREIEREKERERVRVNGLDTCGMFLQRFLELVLPQSPSRVSLEAPPRAEASYPLKRCPSVMVSSHTFSPGF